MSYRSHRQYVARCVCENLSSRHLPPAVCLRHNMCLLSSLCKTFCHPVSKWHIMYFFDIQNTFCSHFNQPSVILIHDFCVVNFKICHVVFRFFPFFKIHVGIHTFYPTNNVLIGWFCINHTIKQMLCFLNFFQNFIEVILPIFLLIICFFCAK